MALTGSVAHCLPVDCALCDRAEQANPCTKTLLVERRFIFLAKVLMEWKSHILPSEGFSACLTLERLLLGV